MGWCTFGETDAMDQNNIFLYFCEIEHLKKKKKGRNTNDKWISLGCHISIKSTSDNQ